MVRITLGIEGMACGMKLLVYGAGVIGCELAHVLKKGGNDVTLLGLPACLSVMMF